MINFDGLGLGSLVTIVAQIVIAGIAYGALRERVAQVSNRVSESEATIRERLAASGVATAATISALEHRIEQVSREQRENGKTLYMLAGQRADIDSILKRQRHDDDR